MFAGYQICQPTAQKDPFRLRSPDQSGNLLLGRLGPSVRARLGSELAPVHAEPLGCRSQLPAPCALPAAPPSETQEARWLMGNQQEKGKQ